MSLGEIYYFDSLLDNYIFPISTEDISKIQFYGYELIKVNDYINLNQKDLNLKLKINFINNFSDKIKKEKNYFAINFWGNLTSPTKLNQVNFFLKKNDFRKKLLEWSKKGFEYDFLKEILELELETIANEDFLIFYGLKVISKIQEGIDKISKLPNNQNLIETKIQIHLDAKIGSNYDEKEKILVVCDQYLSPLFVNLGCIFLNKTENKFALLQDILAITTNKKDIKLIITNGLLEENRDFLDKNLSNYLITHLDIGNTFSKNFFDSIVSKTLGIKIK